MNLKKWFFNKNLQTPIFKEKVAGFNPQKNIAILFEGTDEEDRKTVHAFKKRLKNSNSFNVKSLAFVNNKLPLDNVDYAAYNLKDVNWYGKPSGPKVEGFILGPWDILIFLGEKMHPHFEFIVRHINASFIIGTSLDKDSSYFHLTVESQQNDTLDKKINTIIKSIELISS